MSASAVAGFGIALQKGDGASPEGFTAIAELLAIDGMSLEQMIIDATSHDSANNAKDFISAKLVDAGEVTFSILHLPASTGHKNIIVDMYSGVKRNWKIVFPDSGATTWPFTALIKSFKPSTDLESPLQADIGLKVTGKPTFP